MADVTIPGTKTVYEALVPPPVASKRELLFRRLAYLCVHCGMAHREPNSVVCFNCGEERNIELARQQQKAWDIAA